MPNSESMRREIQRDPRSLVLKHMPETQPNGVQQPVSSTSDAPQSDPIRFPLSAGGAWSWRFERFPGSPDAGVVSPREPCERCEDQRWAEVRTNGYIFAEQ